MEITVLKSVLGVWGRAAGRSVWLGQPVSGYETGSLGMNGQSQGMNSQSQSVNSQSVASLKH